MSSYNKGLIFTNDKCIGCNKCLISCSVPGANISCSKNGKRFLEVNDKLCIACGTCIKTCSHNAREYQDDTVKFFNDIHSGKKISVIIEPSIYLAYEKQISGIIGFLKSLGVEKIYDGSYGNEISIWASIKYLKEKDAENGNCVQFISNQCPALISYAYSCKPKMLEKIIPVQSGHNCSAIYAKKYLKDDSDLALLTTCIASKREIEINGQSGLINYSMTIEKFLSEIETVDLTEYYGRDDSNPIGFGKLTPISGGTKDAVMQFISHEHLFTHYECFVPNNVLLNDTENNSHPIFTEMSGCNYSCINGPGQLHHHNPLTKNFMNSLRHAKKDYAAKNLFSGDDNNFEILSKIFSNLDSKDFQTQFNKKPQEKSALTKSDFDRVFNEMRKDTEDKRNIDCKICGYDTCFKHVEAIARGYSHKESCIHFMNEELVYRLFTDPLTGIPNLSDLQNKMDDYVQKHSDIPLIFAVSNINRLGIVNDMYGYEFGNELVRHVAAAVKAFAGENSLYCRMSGGTFCAIIPYSEDKIRLLSNMNLFPNGNTLSFDYPLTLRTGIYIYDRKKHENPVSPQKLIGMASLAIEFIKEKNENSLFIFTQDMYRKTIEEANITSQMKGALKKNEFVIYFQPQYDHKHNALSGAEALCRWVKEDGTILSPMLFIPVFEKNGFIRELDKYIWDKVFATVRQWLDDGLRIVPISVNISRLSLESDSAVNTIRQLSQHYNIPKKFIHFEITESAYVENPEGIIKRTIAIKDLGFEIAMDDFGAGYSSLNALKDIPIDILKLDMGFLRTKTNSDKGGNIITSIVKMAQNLELKTIAEGVEELTQADFLSSVGCDIIQGNLYSKPLEQEEFIRLLKTANQTIEVHRPKILSSLNVNNFYNSDSSETRIFEHYIGNACIIDYGTNAFSILRSNTKFNTLLEMNSSNLEKDCFQKSFLDNDYNTFIQTINDAIISGDTAVCTTKHYLNKSAKVLFLRSFIRNMSNVSGRNILFVHCIDISNEKENEIELLLKNEKFEMIFEYSPIAICLFKVIPGITKRKFPKIIPIKANATFTQISGYTNEDITGWTSKTALSMIHPADIPGFIYILLKCIANKEIRNERFTYRAKRKDKKYIYVELVANGVVNPDGSMWVITNYIIHNNSRKKHNKAMVVKNANPDILQKDIDELLQDKYFDSNKKEVESEKDTSD